ncbi:MAG: hypothetical protein C4540_00030 [Candidatus Omnitrophota bacterium]|jgi:hypothetical protein|nr:MAG: hypothetical protein C4540_00030 [Candidatus Omnitrophota bacterium]
MKNKSIVILAVFSFITGFMLREMLLNIFERSVAHSKTSTAAAIAQINRSSEEETLEIIKVDLPKKAMRGSYFEIFGHFKRAGSAYQKYDLTVKLVSFTNKVNLPIGPFEFNIDAKLHKPLETKSYAIKVPVPMTIPLGTYRVIIETKLRVTESEMNPALTSNIFNAGTIEIVSYNEGA